MRASMKRLAAWTQVALLVTACTGGSGQGTQAPDGAADSPRPASEGPSQTTAASPSAGGSPSSAAAPLLDQPWATAVLTDVTTGETFRIADLVAAGKVVFVETMAIWCTNCRFQQEEAKVAFDGSDPERIAWVAIDVEPSETAAALARYREEHGFPFTYVIADVDLARALVADFGDVVLSPPSVNIVVVGTDGRVTPLRGHKSVDELRSLATEHGA